MRHPALRIVQIEFLLRVSSRFHRCSDQLRFGTYGLLLADLAAFAGAYRSAGALRLKFNFEQRLPFHCGAPGLPGLVAQMNPLEQTHAWLGKQIFGRGLLSHEQYYQSATSNCKQFSALIPDEASDMRVTGFPPTAAMRSKAQTYEGVFCHIEDEQCYCYPSSKMFKFPAGLTPEGKKDYFLKVARQSLAFGAAPYLIVQRCMDSDLPGKVKVLREFEEVYLGVHFVRLGNAQPANQPFECSCPGFKISSVCWHVAHRQLQAENMEGMALNKKVGGKRQKYKPSPKTGLLTPPLCRPLCQPPF